MRVVIQRVGRASVRVEGDVLGEIEQGLLVLVGFAPGDGPEKIRWICEKLVRLRIFEDGAGKMNLSVADVGGGILLVPQFTLYADAAQGNRPGFSGAAPPAEAEALFGETVRTLKSLAPGPVETGRFGARMRVELVNDGPVTIWLDR